MKRFEMSDQSTVYRYSIIDNVENRVLKVNEYVVLLNKLNDENEQLKSYIDTIFEGNSNICKRLNIEDVQFYCERNRDYCYPSCTYKKCFDENNLIGLKDEIRRCNE